MHPDRIRRDLTRCLFPVAIVALSLLLMEGLFSLRVVPVDRLGSREGVLDAREADFAGSVFQLSGNWEFYPHRLYTAEDFARGRAGEKADPEFSPSDAPAAPTGCAF